MINQFYNFSELLFDNQYGNTLVFSINYGCISENWLHISPPSTEYNTIFTELKNMRS